MGWRDGTVVTSTYSSRRTLGVNSQNPQPSTIAFLGDSINALFRAPQTHVGAGKTLT